MFEAIRSNNCLGVKIKESRGWRMKLTYIVIACCEDGDNYYFIDSVWTSSRKANKRVAELNSKGLDFLLNTYGCGLFVVEQAINNMPQIKLEDEE